MWRAWNNSGIHWFRNYWFFFMCVLHSFCFRSWCKFSHQFTVNTKRLLPPTSQPTFIKMDPSSGLYKCHISSKESPSSWISVSGEQVTFDLFHSGIHLTRWDSPYRETHDHSIAPDACVSLPPACVYYCLSADFSHWLSPTPLHLAECADTGTTTCCLGIKLAMNTRSLICCFGCQWMLGPHRGESGA